MALVRTRSASTLGWAERRSVWEIKQAPLPAWLFPHPKLSREDGLEPRNCGFPRPPVITMRSTRIGHGRTWKRSRRRFGADKDSRCVAWPWERYATAFRTRLVDLVQRYGIRHVKLDGYYLELPGNRSRTRTRGAVGEAMAEGGIAAFTAVRNVQPEVWLESTASAGTEPVVAVPRELGHRDVWRRALRAGGCRAGLSRELHDRPGLTSICKGRHGSGAHRGARGPGGDSPDTGAVHERCGDHCPARGMPSCRSI